MKRETQVTWRSSLEMQGQPPTWAPPSTHPSPDRGVKKPCWKRASNHSSASPEMLQTPPAQTQTFKGKDQHPPHPAPCPYSNPNLQISEPSEMVALCCEVQRQFCNSVHRLLWLNSQFPPMKCVLRLAEYSIFSKELKKNPDFSPDF